MTIALLVDVGVILVLLLSAGVSFFRGLIREVLTILGVVGGALAALMFGDSLKSVTSGWYGIKEGVDAGKLFDVVPMELVADLTAYGVVFIGVFLLLQLASHFLASSAHAVGLGPVDRTFGVFFGLARGVLILGLLYLPFHLILPDNNKKEWFDGSQTMFYVESVAEWMASFLPQDGEVSGVADDARDKLREIDVLGDKRIRPEQAQDVQQNTQQKNGSDSQTGYDKQDRGGMDSLLDQIKNPEKSPEAQGNTQPARGYNE